MRRSALLFPIVLAAGCATSPDTNTARTEEQKPTCVRETHVGSLIPVLNCSRPTDAERQRAIDEVNDVARSRPRDGAGR